MRGLVLAITVAIITAAAVITIYTRLPIDDSWKSIGAVVLTAAVAIQRINGVHRWLAAPKNRRTERLDRMAQVKLAKFYAGRKMTDDLSYICIHVWEVPVWYRKLLPFALRDAMREATEHRLLRFFARFAFRPRLRRASVVGLVQKAPSRVKFRKGKGIVGICIAQNDPDEFVVFNRSPKYKKALQATNEEEWKKLSSTVTNDLSLRDARTLTRSYGQILAKVVQDRTTREALGCVTLSARASNSRDFTISKDATCREIITDLALDVEDVLALKRD